MNPWMASRIAQAARKQRRICRVSFNTRIAAARAGSARIRPIQASRTKVKKQLDSICSLIVRRRDVKRFSGFCVICVTKRETGLGRGAALRPIAVCYHILPRGDESTRWDLRNMIGTCAPCNYGELMSRSTSAQKARMRAIHSAILGEDVLVELEDKAATIAKFSTADLIARRDELKAYLEAGL